MFFGVVQVLLKHRADPNKVFMDGQDPETPLIQAIRMRRTKTLQALVDAGANVNQSFCYQRTEKRLGGILGAKKAMSFGKTLDYAYAQLETEMAVAGYDGQKINWEQAAQYRGPDEGVDLGDVAKAQLIRKLKAAGATSWDLSTQKCEAPTQSVNAVAIASGQAKSEAGSQDPARAITSATGTSTVLGD